MIKFAQIFVLALGFWCVMPSVNAQQTDAQGIKWYTFEEAVELSTAQPRKIVIDLYTHWCGWCKRMDKNTFSDSTVAAYVNANFYPVKFNAEQREVVQFNGYSFKFMEQGSGGVHELAYSLLEGQMGYPTLVYLNEKFERILISPGYKEPAGLMQELKFTKGEFYNKMTFEQYKAGGNE